MNNQTVNYDTIVIGGGQAGLTTGYYLKQHQQNFVILDASDRIGDSWRARWDSLRVFTPARFNALPGMPFPAPPHSFPTKDETADYLEQYAAHFDLPVQSGVWVERLSKQDGRFVAQAGDRRFEAENVIVAMSTYQIPHVPSFAQELDPGIVQLHSSEYRNPSQLKDGRVLVVGAGNSGSEIAMEVARDHPTWMSGRHVGHVPFRPSSFFGRHVGVPFVMRILFHRVMSLGSPIGRRMRPKLLTRAGPLVRVKPRDLDAMGVERLPRTAGVHDGRPVVGEDHELDVENVIWCTGFRPSFSWIDLPIFGGEQNPREPRHRAGIVPEEPGLYFVGLFFLYALSSSLFCGVARDAERVVEHLAARTASDAIEGRTRSAYGVA